jgi:hypothetical protein
MTRIDFITNRTQKMIARAGGPRYCCMIAILSTTALILFMLVLYT